MPDHLNDWKHFVNLTEQLQKAGIIKAVKDLWWDVRPHPGFGTVEVRVCDLPVNYKEIFALVALIQALVVKIKKEILIPISIHKFYNQINGKPRVTVLKACLLIP